MNPDPQTELPALELDLLTARVDDIDRSGGGAVFSFLGREIIFHASGGDTQIPPIIAEFYNTHLNQIVAAGQIGIEGTRSTNIGGEEKIGRTFWEVYKARIRESLCNKNGELYKMTMRDGKASTKVVIASLAGALGIGSAFGGLLCGLTVILLNTGLDAFCEWSQPTDKKVGS